MLDPRTQKLIDDLFQGKTCSKCGEQANRLIGGEFRCFQHIAADNNHKARLISSERVYRTHLRNMK